MVKGDNMSVANVDADEQLAEVLKAALKDTPPETEDETSYNFGRNLIFSESKNLDFPKMSTKLGGKDWKAGEAARTLSRYFAILDFGRNAIKTYGKKEDKPLWWPRRPKWKKFRCPSKVSKDVCNQLIQCLLEHYGVDASQHYIGYPEDELSSNSSSDSEEETEVVSGGDDPVADDDEEEFGNLNDEYVDEMNSGRNYVLLGKRRRGT